MQTKLKLGWPQALVLAVAIAAFAAVYTYAPEDRDTLEKGVLAAWGAASTLLGPLLQRRGEDLAERVKRALDRDRSQMLAMLDGMRASVDGPRVIGEHGPVTDDTAERGGDRGPW